MKHKIPPLALSSSGYAGRALRSSQPIQAPRSNVVVFNRAWMFLSNRSKQILYFATKLQLLLSKITGILKK